MDFSPADGWNAGLHVCLAWDIISEVYIHGMLAGVKLSQFSIKLCRGKSAGQKSL